MKMSELKVGAPRGSQKDAKLTPGTDDPSTYMRDKGEWEAYREPQGINSPAGKIASGRKKGQTKTKNKKTSTAEGFQPSGAGTSNDMVPRGRDALTLSAVSDTTKQNRAKGASMPGSEAPTKVAKANVKKSLSNTPGDTRELNEAVPRAWRRDYNADYELRDDKDEQVIGVANIRNGFIESMAVRNDLAEDFEGHIMSRLLGTIVRDADLADANLAIQMDHPDDLQQKRFLERFGFRETGNGVLKRNAGSVTPPSVPATRL